MATSLQKLTQTLSDSDVDKVAALPSASHPKTVVVHDEAFNGTSVVVAGLSSAKRYRLNYTLDANGVDEEVKLQPNGSDAGCACFYRASGAGAPLAYLELCYLAVGQPSTVGEATIGPRVNGLSMFKADNGAADVLGFSSYMPATARGGTTTDFTSITILLAAATARTGWLKITEETP